MKKVVLGGLMMLTSIISINILISVSLRISSIFLGWKPYMWFIRNRSLEIPFYTLIVIAVIGFALSLWGLFERNRDKQCTK